jgi:hypothetical protein
MPGQVRCTGSRAALAASPHLLPDRPPVGSIGAPRLRAREGERLCAARAGAVAAGGELGRRRRERGRWSSSGSRRGEEGQRRLVGGGRGGGRRAAGVVETMRESSATGEEDVITLGYNCRDTYGSISETG